MNKKNLVSTALLLTFIPSVIMFTIMLIQFVTWYFDPNQNGWGIFAIAPLFVFGVAALLSGLIIFLRQRFYSSGFDSFIIFMLSIIIIVILQLLTQ